MLLHTRAIVVRRRSFGQHSYVLSLLTPSEGMLFVRYFRGKVLMPALAQPPQSLVAVIYYNPFRALSTLKESALLDGFWKMYESSRLLTMALTVVEIAESFYSAYKMDREAFEDVLAALRYIEHTLNPHRVVVYWCVVRLLRSAGVFPYSSAYIEPSFKKVIDGLVRASSPEKVNIPAVDRLSGKLWQALSNFCLEAGIDLRNLRSLLVAREILRNEKAQ